MRNKLDDSVRKCFNTKDGKEALAALKAIYVDPSCVGADTHQTYYNLANKELIQMFIQLLDNPDELNDIDIYNTYMNGGE